MPRTPQSLDKRIQKAADRYGLGRLPASDERDARFPMRAVLATEPPPTRYWPMWAKPLNQGDAPQCVAYAWMHMLLAAPTVHGAGPDVLGNVELFADSLYHRAQRVDEWAGENYDGTSVRAGAKALQAEGRLLEYRWASDIWTVEHFVRSRGVVVFGTNWYERMFVPDAQGYLRPEGGVVGGHAYCLIGYSHQRQAFRVLNSWGVGWARNGRAWLARADAERLLREDGEACSGWEVKIPNAMRVAA